ncbi:S41 family peptidase [Denitratimonas sp. CY0512]|uniref:S41 family peptidase n=1 Tax=Denitratimonas sp. CY0512 TaxID=3131940 RepID=UPI0030B56C13
MNRLIPSRFHVALALVCALIFSAPLAAREPAATPPADSSGDSGQPAESGTAADTEATAEETDVADAADAEDAEDAEDAVSLDEIRRFVAVFRAVKQGYVDPIDDATLMRAAIRGLLIDLDPHSAYLDAEQSRALNEAASGAYEGLGLEVIQQPDRSLLVIAPIDETPAARAGILPGDVITAIDGEPITVDGVDAAIDSMRGAAGSQTRLTVEREGAAEPLLFTLTREIIRVASVRVKTLEPGYVYARISTFQADTGLELDRKLQQAMQQNEGEVKGLVLDLRSNPGGLLNAAVEAADLFLDDGLIVSTRGRLPHSRSELGAHNGDLLEGAPIAILVDGGTASAAEVLAGALRDHNRALVLGSPTFGKGSVQTVLPLDNGDSIKLTTARYYTPSGTSIQATGIIPDVPLESRIDQIASVPDQPPTVRERDLPGHLRGDNETPEAEAAVDSSIPIIPLQRPEELDDSGVREALNMLKGLSVFRERSDTRASD